MIITNKYEDPEREECCVSCGVMPDYPFLFWTGSANHFKFCADCCQKMKRGFIADLVHIAAIKELSDLGCTHTLIAQSDGEVKAKLQERKKLEDEYGERK